MQEVIINKQARLSEHFTLGEMCKTSAKTADGNIIVVACLSTVTLVSIAMLVLNRKKKHN